MTRPQPDPTRPQPDPTRPQPDPTGRRLDPSRPQPGRRLDPSRPLLDLSVYLVTDTTLCGELGVPATVSAAVAAGATLVQLRDPDATDEEFVALGRAVRAALEGTGVPLLLNDRVHLVDEVGAQGAHVGQSDLDIGEARARLGRAAYLGLSAQTTEHVAAARAHGLEAVDYVGVGPVWPQTTKPGAGAPGGIDRLRGIVAMSPWPVVAIGGVTAERLPQIRAAGAAGAAVVSAICGQPDVGAATRRLRRAWDAAGDAAGDSAADAASDAAWDGSAR